MRNKIFFLLKGSFLTFFVFACLICGTGVSDDFSDPEAETYQGLITLENVKVNEGNILALIEQLGSDEWQKREEAQQKLLQMGNAAVELLKKNQNNPDPEIRMRLNTILKELSESKDNDILTLRVKKQEMTPAQYEEWLNQSPEIKVRLLVAAAIGEGISPYNPFYCNSDFKCISINVTLPYLLMLFEVQKTAPYRQRIARLIAEACLPGNQKNMNAIKQAARKLNVEKSFLALLDDPDPLVRFWGVCAAGRQSLDLPETLLLKLLSDKQPRVNDQAFIYLPRLCNKQSLPLLKKLLLDYQPGNQVDRQEYLFRAIQYLSDKPVDGLASLLKVKTWLKNCLLTIQQGPLLEQAGALRALKELVFSHAPELISEFAQGNESERSILEYALMQIPELLIDIDTYETKHPVTDELKNAFAHLCLLHQGYQKVRALGPYYKQKQESVWPAELGDQEKDLIKLSLEALVISDQIPRLEGKYKLLCRPLDILIGYEKGRMEFDKIADYDKKAALDLMVQESINFPYVLGDAVYLRGIEKTGNHPLILKAASLGMQWMLEKRYLFSYTVPNPTLLLYLARYGDAAQKEKISDYILNLSDDSLKYLKRSDEFDSIREWLSKPVEKQEQKKPSLAKPSAWYRQCAAHVADPHLAIAGGAVNALLWSGPEGAVALLEQINQTANDGPNLPVLLSLAVLHAHTQDMLTCLKTGENKDKINQEAFALLEKLLAKKLDVIRDIISTGFNRSYSTDEKKAKHEQLAMNDALFNFLFLFAYIRNNHAPILTPLETILQKRLTLKDGGMLLAQLPRSSRMSDFFVPLDDRRIIPFLRRDVSEKRPFYALCYNMDLFSAAAHFGLVENLPDFLNYATRDTTWPDLGVTAIADLKSEEGLIDLEQFWRYAGDQPEAKNRVFVLEELRMLTALAQFRLGDLRGLRRAIKMLPSLKDLHCAPSFIKEAICQVVDFEVSLPERWDWSAEKRKEIELEFTKWLEKYESQLSWVPEQHRYKLK